MIYLGGKFSNYPRVYIVLVNLVALLKRFGVQQAKLFRIKLVLFTLKYSISDGVVPGAPSSAWRMKQRRRQLQETTVVSMLG